MDMETPPSSADQAIEFTNVPAIGSYLNLKGIVHHVEPDLVCVAVYIRVHGGWWTKPYWDAPTTPVAPDGTFSVNVTTGGSDDQATEIAAFLVPSEYYPPGLRGEPAFPDELLQKALASASVTRTP